MSRNFSGWGADAFINGAPTTQAFGRVGGALRAGEMAHDRRLFCVRARFSTHSDLDQADVQAGRLSRIFLCKVVSRSRAHWGFANSKIGQDPLAPPSRNLIHADKNVLPSQACGDKCVFCICVENTRVRRVHIGGKASTYVSVMRLYAG